MDHGIPIWPFLFSSIGGVITFGLLSDQSGRVVAYIRLFLLGTGTCSLFIMGILLVIHEPWTGELIDKGDEYVRRGWIIDVINLILSIGPQTFGIIVFAIAVYCALGFKDHLWLVRRGIYKVDLK